MSDSNLSHLSRQDLIDCVKNLLVGLEIQQIDYFLSRLTPENCSKLGQTYSEAVKQKLSIIEHLRARTREIHEKYPVGFVLECDCVKGQVVSPEIIKHKIVLPQDVCVQWENGILSTYDKKWLDMHAKPA